MIKCTGLNKSMGDNFNGWAKWYLLKLLDSSFIQKQRGGTAHISILAIWWVGKGLE